MTGPSPEAAERRRARDRIKMAKRWQAKRAERLAAVAKMRSKTDPAYRRQLPPAPEMSKNEMRAVIAQAVRYTAGLPA